MAESVLKSGSVFLLLLPFLESQEGLNLAFCANDLGMGGFDSGEGVVLQRDIVSACWEQDQS